MGSGSRSLAAEGSAGDFPGPPAKLLATFRSLPEWLRKGPWSPLALLSLIALALCILFSFPLALREAPTCSALLASRVGGVEAQAEVTVRAAAAFWGWGLIAVSIGRRQHWIYCSYTMWTWVLESSRLAWASLSDLTPCGCACSQVSETLRFAALAQACVTVVVWWSVMFPAICLMAEKDDRKAFVKFSVSPVLLNVHFLVLVSAGGDYVFRPRLFTLWDLWGACAVGLGYLAFYLSVLDPRDVQLYAFLSPRTHFAPLAYFAVPAVYFCLFRAVNTSSLFAPPQVWAPPSISNALPLDYATP